MRQYFVRYWLWFSSRFHSFSLPEHLLSVTKWNISVQKSWDMIKRTCCHFIWEACGNFPFTYTFLDDTFNDLYKSEQRTGFLFNIFASIAILIFCLGLFGLAVYTAQIRKREIGVRKVLGSSMAGIIQLLPKDFIKLVIIGIVIAIPIAWYAMDKWLRDFAYKIEMQWWVLPLLVCWLW